jgi:hypothetical protein
MPADIALPVVFPLQLLSLQSVPPESVSKTGFSPTLDDPIFDIQSQDRQHDKNGLRKGRTAEQRDVPGSAVDRARDGGRYDDDKNHRCSVKRTVEINSP